MIEICGVTPACRKWSIGLETEGHINYEKEKQRDE
jgi:hypothetical protein